MFREGIIFYSFNAENGRRAHSYKAGKGLSVSALSTATALTTKSASYSVKKVIIHWSALV